jgi:hypothetical protein
LADARSDASGPAAATNEKERADAEMLWRRERLADEVARDIVRAALGGGGGGAAATDIWP